MAHALVFDSGVGGLSVVAKLHSYLPDLYITYVADDEFRPYGNKSEAELQTRLPGLIQSLVLMCDPDIIVLACNTASTTALRHIRSHVKIPVVGVVPAIKPAAQISQSKTIAVLGTPGTVRRKYVSKLIKDFAENCRVLLHGSAGLVVLAEKKLAGHEISIREIRAEIAPLIEDSTANNADCVVLACTHFPLLAEELQIAAPHIINWVDSGQAVAKRVRSVLSDITCNRAPDYPQTAFLIGGTYNKARCAMFANYGFKKTVVL